MIVCSALKYKDGTLICGARHYDSTMRKMIDKLNLIEETPMQGFIDEHGNFFNRGEALKIATYCKQINDRTKTYPQNLLFSEDLY